MAKPFDVTDADFDERVLRRSEEVPVLVDFWADWCQPCHMLAPVIEKAVAAHDGKIELAKLDVDANQVTAAWRPSSPALSRPRWWRASWTASCRRRPTRSWRAATRPRCGGRSRSIRTTRLRAASWAARCCCAARLTRRWSWSRGGPAAFSPAGPPP